MPPNEEQPWDGTERRSGIDRRNKDRWVIEDDQLVISDRRAAPRSEPASPPTSGALAYCKAQFRRIRGR